MVEIWASIPFTYAKKTARSPAPKKTRREGSPGGTGIDFRLNLSIDLLFESIDSSENPRRNPVKPRNAAVQYIETETNGRTN